MPGLLGGPAGDALVTVEFVPHPLFRVEGDTLRRDLSITLDEAVLGAKVRVPTLDGQVSVNVPAWSSGGRALRLKGKGLPRSGGARGDLLVDAPHRAPGEARSRSRRADGALAGEQALRGARFGGRGRLSGRAFRFAGAEPPQLRGAAARRRRSLIASPRPYSGIGITAIVRPATSRARSAAKRLAAASPRSPDSLRLRSATALLRSRERRPEGEQRFAGPDVLRMEAKGRGRRIVRGEHAGRARSIGISAGKCQRPADHRLDRAPIEAAGTEQHGHLAVQADNGRFEANRRRPGVEYDGDQVAEIRRHVRRSGRADMAGAVGAWRGERPAEGRQKLMRHRMGGDPDGDRAEAGGDKIGNPRALAERQHEGSGPGQKAAARCRAGS